LAEAQRGRAEDLGTNQFPDIGVGLHQFIAEASGDIINRISDIDAGGGYMYSLSATREKIDRVYDALTEPSGFAKEIDGQLRANIRGTNTSYEDAKEAMRQWGLEYASEYRKLPTYNQAQRDAQEVAIAIGEGRYDDAKEAVLRIKLKLEGNVQRGASKYQPEMITVSNEDAFRYMFDGADEVGFVDVPTTAATPPAAVRPPGGALPDWAKPDFNAPDDASRADATAARAIWDVTTPGAKPPTIAAAERARGQMGSMLSSYPDVPPLLARRGEVEAFLVTQGRGDILMAQEEVKAARKFWEGPYGGRGNAPQWERVILNAEEAVKRAGGTIDNIPPAAAVTPPPAARRAASRAERASGEGVVPPRKPPTDTGAVPSVPGDEKFAGNINLEKFPEDVHGRIRTWADTNPEKIDIARRGVISDAEVLARAERLVNDNGGSFQKLKDSWKPGTAWNAEEMVAMEGVILDNARDLMKLAGKIANPAEGTKASAEVSADFLIAVIEGEQNLKILSGVKAEAGRGLRAQRQVITDGLRASDTKVAESNVAKLIRQMSLTYDNVDDLAAAINAIDINDPAAVLRLLSHTKEPGFWDYIIQYWQSAILSSPKTHIQNFASNLGLTIGSPLERGAVAAVDTVLSNLPGRLGRPRARFFDEVSADAVGAIGGLGDGFRSMWKVLRTGPDALQSSKYERFARPYAGRESIGKGKFKISGPKVERNTRWAGNVVTGSFRALEAADSLFYSVNYGAALHTGATRIARIEGLKGTEAVIRVANLVNDPPASLIKQSVEEADYRLFRQEPPAWVTSLGNFTEDKPFFKFVIPFRRTPYNLVKFGIQRSPAGFLNPSMYRNLAAKNPEAAEQLARAMMGTVGAIGLAMLFDKGEITGAAPTDRVARDEFYGENKLPYAIKVGGRWISYEKLEPLNQTFTQVAAYVQAIADKKDDKTIGEIGMKAAMTIGAGLDNGLFVQQVNDFTEMVINPDRNFEDYMTRLITGGIPASSMMRTIAQGTDPTFKQPTNIAESLQSIIPGMSKNVPSRVDAFGNEIQRSWVWSPIKVSKVQEDAVRAELNKYDVHVGFVGSSIRNHKLSPELQREYQVLAGQKIYIMLTNLMQYEGYQKATDEQKADALDDVVNKARSIIRGEDASFGVTPEVESFIKRVANEAAREEGRPEPYPQGTNQPMQTRNTVVTPTAPAAAPQAPPTLTRNEASRQERAAVGAR
jgi:hypothetical protein